jgi:hypothetical protein
MKLKQIYDNYIVKIKEVLEKDDFDGMDYILEYMYQAGIPDDVMEEMDDILQEMTLYIEFKEAEYKEEALAIISDIEEELKA